MLIYIRTMIFTRALKALKIIRRCPDAGLIHSSALKNIYRCLEVALIHLNAVIFMVKFFFIMPRTMEI
jgi:hypothetical protein